jgi:hypothetical protein
MAQQSAPCIINPIMIFEGVLTFIVTLAWNQTFGSLAKKLLPGSSDLAVNSLHAIMVTLFVLVIILILRYFSPIGERYESGLDVLNLTRPFVNNWEREPGCKSAGGRQSRDYVLIGGRASNS